MDYYNILGVQKNSSPDEIKKAYKRAAMKNHPDRGGDSSKFQQIQEAYDVLSDPQKKQMYDQYGTADPQKMGGFNQDGYNPFGGNFNDMFSTMFGQGFRNQVRRNRDIQIVKDITLLDALTGKQIDLAYRMSSGKTETVTVDIPAGIHSGQTVRYAGLGDDQLPVARGDLLVKIRVLNDTHWVRQDNDLYRKATINVFDLMLGTTIDVDMIDGKMLSLKIPAGTKVGSKFSIPEHGMPIRRTGRRGKAYIVVETKIPRISDEDLISKLTEIKNEINIKS